MSMGRIRRCCRSSSAAAAREEARVWERAGNRVLNCFALSQRQQLLCVRSACASNVSVSRGPRGCGRAHGRCARERNWGARCGGALWRRSRGTPEKIWRLCKRGGKMDAMAQSVWSRRLSFVVVVLVFGRGVKSPGSVVGGGVQGRERFTGLVGRSVIAPQLF
jgi:hypothetical protein